MGCVVTIGSRSERVLLTWLLCWRDSSFGEQSVSFNCSVLKELSLSASELNVGRLAAGAAAPTS